MKRSRINRIIKESEEFIKEQGFLLPPFASWTPKEWIKKGSECDEIRDNMLGWDITDFGLGDFDRKGLTLITIRNGNQYDKKYDKTYAEKILISREGQVCPMHFHWNKMEDIINRGGGILMMQLYNSTEDEKLSDTDVHVVSDGTALILKAGTVMELLPGQSVTLTRGLYHSFWAKEGSGTVMVGEVSQCNDDNTDNRFLEGIGRFPQIEEDEAPYRLLCNEYPDTIDSHAHVFDSGVEGVSELIRFEEEFGYQAFNYLSCECMGDAAQNALGIYLKLIAPTNYAYGGLHYRFPYSFADEAKKLIEIGFDGMKMVENKPTIRKLLSMASDDPGYDEFYAYLEQKDIPMIVHVADPEEFWDRDAIPSWAMECGYYYGDGSFAAKEQLYDEIFNVLARYPRLRISFAHFFFLSGDRERLAGLLERFPNMGLDIVAGTEMYFNFTKDQEGWRNFFLKYQDRIIFGTDNMNHNNPADIENAKIINRLERDFIRTDRDIPAWDKTIKGIGLPVSVQRKIFRDNFLRLSGAKPKPVNIPAAIRYLNERLNDGRYELTKRERGIIQLVLDYCRKEQADSTRS